ncbi:MAG: penicillin-binding protein 2 [Aquificae bacterium]|nr:penicillin-binding protein 2 [Aquificota bacterium]
MERSFRNKVLFIAFAFALLSAVAVGRLIYVNLKGDEIVENAARSFKDVTIKVLPRYRAAITDRHGKPLALSYPVGYVFTFKFYAFKDEEKKRKLARVLARLLNLDERELLKLFELKRPSIELATFPLERTEEVARAIKSVDYDPKKGRYEKPFISSFVNVGEKFERFYPHGRLASNLLGFVKKDGSGGGGLEYQFEERLLGGKKRFVRYILYRDKGFLFLEPLDEEELVARELRLSLDFRLQAAVEEIKREIVRKFRPKKVVVVVMESKTGKIRAFTTYPDFDPNRTRVYKPYTRNFGTVDLFEPGSTFKPFLVAYALEKGIIGPRTLIKIDYGRTVVHRKTLRDPVSYLRKKKFITPEELLVYSSNVGAVKLGLRLSAAQFKELLSLFRLDETPRVLLGETPPLIADLRNEVNRAYASIGQGLSFNALHLLSSFNALVTGRWVKPSILEDEEPEVRPLPLSPSTVKWVRRTLVKVVEEGTGRRAKTELYFVGGKTGTAQKFDARLKRYSNRKLTTFFVGFFPSEPRFTALILVDEPKGKELYGGTVAAPFFKKLVEKAAVIYGLEPDKR